MYGRDALIKRWYRSCFVLHIRAQLMASQLVEPEQLAIYSKDIRPNNETAVSDGIDNSTGRIAHIELGGHDFQLAIS